MSLAHRGEDLHVDAVRSGDVVTLKGPDGERTFAVEQVSAACWLLRGDGEQHVAHVALSRGAAWVHVDGRTHVLEAARPPSRRDAGGGDGTLVAPMTGRVVEVLVETGAAVPAGAVVLVLSAMKMRVEVKAPFAGTVRVDVDAGEQVEGGAVLAVVERKP